MSRNQILVLAGAILGFIILIIGSLGYMKVFALDETISYVLMGIGIVAVIAALAVVSLKKDLFLH